MPWIDWAIISVLLISSLISFVRGFVKEAMSLVVWLLAFLVATGFSPYFAPLLADYLSEPSFRQLAAFAILFIATLVTGGLANYLLSTLIKVSGLSGTDRLLGVIFGCARGLIVIMVFVIFAPQLVEVQQDSWWQESQLIPHFVQFEDQFKQLSAMVYTSIAAWF